MVLTVWSAAGRSERREEYKSLILFRRSRSLALWSSFFAVIVGVVVAILSSHSRSTSSFECLHSPSPLLIANKGSWDKRGGELRNDGVLELASASLVKKLFSSWVIDTESSKGHPKGENKGGDQDSICWERERVCFWRWESWKLSNN